MRLLREKLQLSVSEMAGLIGVPRSTYAMYESNRRNINTQALLKIGKIEAILLNAAANRTPFNAKLNQIERRNIEKANANIDKLKKKVERDLLFTRTKLEKLQEKQHKILNLINLINALKKEDMVAKNDEPFYNLFEAKLYNKLKTCNSFLLFNTQQKIMELEYKKQILKHLIF